MKSKVFLAVGLVVLLVLAGLAGCSAAKVGAADTQPISVNINSDQGIWVTGQGKMTVVPDLAILNVGVIAKADKVSEAQSQAAAAMDKLMAALKGSGIDEKDIKTQYFNIQQVTRWDDSVRQSVNDGFEVSNMLTVKIRVMDKVSSVIDSAVEAGGDLIRINGVSVTVENPEKSYAEARQKAVQDARARAEDIARLAGVSLGKATFISESASQPSTYVRSSYDWGVPAPAVMESASSYISPGQTDITLYVQINYSIQ